jgi:hypothetical protein
VRDIVVDIGDDDRMREQLDEHDVRAVSCECWGSSGDGERGFQLRRSCGLCGAAEQRSERGQLCDCCGARLRRGRADCDERAGDGCVRDIVVDIGDDDRMWLWRYCASGRLRRCYGRCGCRDSAGCAELRCGCGIIAV